MNKSSRISNTRKNFRTGCRCLGGRAGCGAACLAHQVRAAGRMAELLGEAVGLRSRQGPPGSMAPASAVRLVRQSRTGSASRGSAQAAPARGLARTASRDPRRGSKTCQQRYLGTMSGRLSDFRLVGVASASGRGHRRYWQGFSFPHGSSFARRPAKVPSPKGFLGVHSHRGACTASHGLVAQVP